MSSAIQKDSPEMPKSGRPRVRDKGKKITSRMFLTKAILAIRLRRLQIFLIRIDSKNLEERMLKKWNVSWRVEKGSPSSTKAE